MKLSFLKKRQVILALFLYLFSTAALAALCQAEGDLTFAAVRKVVDGDTLELTDGRKVRLVGVNTPELDHEKGNHQAFAVAATKRLRQLVQDGVYWQAAFDDEDRYGRKLYYLFTKDRNSVASQLLSDGLGYRIAIPPNLAYQDCFVRSEAQAREKRVGLWQRPPQWQPQAGFVVARHTVTSITHNRGGWWLETDQDLVINIPPYAQNLWREQDVYLLANQLIEARGWQYQRKNQNRRYKSWVLTVKHPLDLKRAED